ncbi:class I SAM-dependent methyltransferase [Actinomadura sp. B10D3]|uniref:class I SAM-dependent methyltransferase n=1 Tax=Actinomadura sp. B10D3 TaxID=3153557 RepID=UPI00325D2884
MSTTSSIAAFWDAAASTFDNEADHGLRDPHIRNAWATRLNSWLPSPPSDVLDLGCGTGSLSLLLAQHGHRVVAVDLSPNMVEHARHKLTAAGFDAHVLVGDAAHPPSLKRSFDVILARHLLWTLPDPAVTLQRWTGLSHPGGQLILIEGRWNTSAGDDIYPENSHALPWMGGVTATTLTRTLQPLVSDLRVEPLADPDLWGRRIDDERYAVIATL